MQRPLCVLVSMADLFKAPAVGRVNRRLDLTAGARK